MKLHYKQSDVEHKRHLAETSLAFTLPGRDETKTICEDWLELWSEIERLRNTMSLYTAAIDPEESEETDDWDVTDVRWRERIDQMHAEIERPRAAVEKANSFTGRVITWDSIDARCGPDETVIHVVVQDEAIRDGRVSWGECILAAEAEEVK